MTHDDDAKQITLVRRRDDVDEHAFAQQLIDHGALIAQHYVRRGQGRGQLRADRSAPLREDRPADTTDRMARPRPHVVRLDASGRRGPGAIRIPNKLLTDHLLEDRRRQHRLVGRRERRVDVRPRLARRRSDSRGQTDVTGRRRRPTSPSTNSSPAIATTSNVAKVHHIGCWQYVQNFIAAPTGTRPAPLIDGISELWFRSVDDMIERFYTAPGSPDAVRDDTTGFIDFANTRSYLTIETIVFSRCGEVTRLGSAVDRLGERDEVAVGIAQTELAHAPFALLRVPTRSACDDESIGALGHAAGIDVQRAGEAGRLGPRRVTGEELQDHTVALRPRTTSPRPSRGTVPATRNRHGCTSRSWRPCRVS